MRNLNNFSIDPYKFKKLINERGIKSKDLAEMVGINPSEMSRYTTLKKYAVSPRSSLFKAICAALDITPDQLLPDPVAAMMPKIAQGGQQTTLGVIYNGRVVDQILLNDRVFWKSNGPAVKVENRKSECWRLPEILAGHLARSLAAGLELVQGSRLLDRDAILHHPPDE